MRLFELLLILITSTGIVKINGGNFTLDQSEQIEYCEY